MGRDHVSKLVFLFKIRSKSRAIFEQLKSQLNAVKSLILGSILGVREGAVCDLCQQPRNQINRRIIIKSSEIMDIIVIYIIVVQNYRVEFLSNTS